MDSKSRPKIKPFTGVAEEWLEFKGKFRAVLHTEKLTHALTAVRPSEAPDLAEWKADDESLFFQLVLFTEGSAGRLVWQYDSETKGQEAWKALVSKYEKAGNIGKNSLTKQLANMTMSENEDPDDFFIRFESTANRLEVLGQKVPDDMLLCLLLGKLPKSYQGVTNALNVIDGLTLEKAKGHVKDCYTQMLEDGYIKGSSRGGGEKALFTRDKKQKQKKGGGYNNPRHQSLTCHGCGEVGHIKPNCPKEKSKPSGEDQRKKSQPKPFSGKCNVCGKVGHKAINCQVAKAAIARFLEEQGEATSMEEDHFALMADPFGASAMPHSSKHTWIVDSGCTSSMTSMRDAFTTLEAGEGQVVVAGGKVLRSTGKGTICGSIMRSNGRSMTISMSNVLLVPDLDANLLSVKSLASRGARVVFNDNESYIEVGSNKLPINMTGNLYRVDIMPSMGSTEDAHQAMTAVTAELVHARMGHANAKAIAEATKLDVGLPQTKPSDSVCDTCEVSKHERARFPVKKDAMMIKDGSLKSFEIIHVDLFGPMDTRSIGGARYGMNVICRSTKWRFFYALEYKDQALPKFKDCMRAIKAMTGGAAKVRRLHSDGGGEFISKLFEDYCTSMGILQTTTGPHTPEQNGIAERTNRTVQEMARAKRLHAGLPKEFWALCCDCTVHTLNRLPSSAIGWETPYKKVFGKDARLDYFKVFGCRAYVHVYDHERKKLDPKAWRGIMVGYHPHNYRCYRIYDPLRRRVYMSTHASFDEMTYPGKGNQQAMEVPGTKIGTAEQPRVPEPGPVEPNENTRGQQESSTHHGPVTVTRRRGAAIVDTPSEVANARGRDLDSVGATEADLPDSATGDSAWTSPWCNDPGCSNKSVHMAHLGIHYAYAVAHDIYGDPMTHEEAMRAPEADLWKEAEKSEYQSLMENKTWILVPMPKGNVNVVGSRWLFKTKRDGNGNIVKYKARLVAQGFTQEHGIDYDETHSSVVRFTSVRLIFAIAASQDLIMHTMDVDTAFLNATLQELIYLRQPKGFVQRGPNGEELVCKLEKALYGLKQASRNWNLTINEWLTSDYGMTRSQADACVYVQINGEQKLYVTVWVDDLIIAGSDMGTIKDFKDAIARRFKMKDLGVLTSVLGMEVTRDSTTGDIKLSQVTYLKKVLERFGLGDCHPVGTPIEGNLTRLEGGKPSHKYMSIVGSLMYASVVCRPDITFAVQALSRHFQSCGPDHLNAAERVLKYLRGTIDKGIIYKSGTSAGKAAGLIGYSDSDWGSDTDTRRSTTGYLFTFNRGAISWGSRLQATVALSSSEAEYMALTAATQEAIHLRQLLADLGISISNSTIIYEDNVGCIAMSSNPVFHKRTKHIAIKYHFVRERVESGEVNVKYVPTNQQLADILTKPLSKQKIIFLSNCIMEGAIIT